LPWESNVVADVTGLRVVQHALHVSYIAYNLMVLLLGHEMLRVWGVR
jgi:hypothetical protein